MRINKFLALCGLGSRRKCEQLILDGRVTINDVIVSSFSCLVGGSDVVMVDGQIVEQKTFLYVMLFKPKGFVTTKHDDKGRKTVMSLLPSEWQHLNPVGRLDYETEGLLLFTNNGELANLLTHPSFHIDKKYIVKIEGHIVESELAVLRAGVVIDGKRTEPAKVKVVLVEKNKTTIEMIIFEGRNRQIRKMMDAIGKTIIFLKRVQFGPLNLGGLQRGKCRQLRKSEIFALEHFIEEKI